MRIFTVLCALSLWVLSAYPQNSGFLEDNQNLSDAVLITPTFGIQFPGGDLQDDFGQSFGAGMTVEWMHSQRNWIYGLDGQLMFGSDVKRDVLSSLRTSRGFVLNEIGQPVSLFLRQRMLYLGGHVGRLIPMSKSNARSGLRVTLGAGFFRHHIRFVDEENSFSLLDGDFKKGFDRYTNGIAVREFIGYQLMSRNRLSNFYIGAELIQGFTKNRRSFDYAARRSLSDARLDLTYGVRIGWTLVIYTGEVENGDVYY